KGGGETVAVLDFVELLFVPVGVGPRRPQALLQLFALGRTQVDQPDPVAIDVCQGVSVRTERTRRAKNRLPPLQEIAGFHVPDQQTFVNVPGSQRSAIPAERHARNRAGIALADQELLARPRVPQPRRPILTRRRQPRPVRAERHTPNAVGMALALQEGLA